MFIDVCFPKNNEKKFIEIAEKLDIDKLCFVYEDKKNIKKIESKKVDISYGIMTLNPKKESYPLFSYFPPVQKTKMKMLYFHDPGKIKKKNFHSPTKEFTQVHIKDLNNNPLGVSYAKIIESKFKDLEKIYLLIKLCRKYKKRLFFASFTNDPYKLRSKQDIKSMLRIIGMDTKQLKESMSNLYNHFNNV